MAKYKCTRKCFFQNRRRNPGDILELSADSVIPSHIVPLAKAPKEKAKEVDPMSKPMSLKELQEKEALDALKGMNPTKKVEEEIKEEFLG